MSYLLFVLFISCWVGISVFARPYAPQLGERKGRGSSDTVLPRFRLSLEQQLLKSVSPRSRAAARRGKKKFDNDNRRPARRSFRSFFSNHMCTWMIVRLVELFLKRYAPHRGLHSFVDPTTENQSTVLISSHFHPRITEEACLFSAQLITSHLLFS